MIDYEDKELSEIIERHRKFTKKSVIICCILAMLVLLFVLSGCKKQHVLSEGAVRPKVFKPNGEYCPVISFGICYACPDGYNLNFNTSFPEEAECIKQK